MGTQGMCQAALVFDSPIAQLGHGRDDSLLALWPVGGTEQRREGGLRVARLLEILCRVWSKKVNGENEGGGYSNLVRTRTFSTSSMKTENSLP